MADASGSGARPDGLPERGDAGDRAPGVGSSDPGLEKTLRIPERHPACESDDSSELDLFSFFLLGSSRSVPLSDASDDGTQADPPKIGEIIGDRYRVEGTIGEGAFGTVYEVRHLLLPEKPLVAKFAKHVIFHGLEAESRILPRLDHPGIVRILDRFNHGGSEVIVLERAPGKTLHERLKEGVLNIPVALGVATTLVQALQYAHDRTVPVVHRDLKPGNINVDESNGRVVILDFGIAREGNEGGGGGGTRGWRAPEFHSGPFFVPAGPQTGDPAVDIWSLGAIIHFMLSGCSRGIDTADLPDWATVESPVPSELMHLVDTMMDEDPARRPRAAEVADRLASIAKSLTAAHNLTIRTNSFVGRKSELEQLKLLLAKERRVDVYGPGGVGKSRLVTEAALGMMTTFTGGIAVVDLTRFAPLDDPRPLDERVPEFIATKVLGARSGVLERRAVLAEQDFVLVILDNAECLSDEQRKEIDRLVIASPAWRFVVLSRVSPAPLDHHALEVKPFGAKASETGGIDPAVNLLLDRFGDYRSGFEGNGERMKALAAIADRLDRLPLALELAALSIGSLRERRRLDGKGATAEVWLREISASLDGNPEMLDALMREAAEHASESLPERHRSIFQAVRWSYELLDPEAQHLLRRLSIFGGEFVRIDAEQVCNWDGALRRGVRPSLAMLERHGLIRLNGTGMHSIGRLRQTVQMFAHSLGAADQAEWRMLSEWWARQFLFFSAHPREEGVDSSVPSALYRHTQAPNSPLRQAFPSKTIRIVCVIRSAIRFAESLRNKNQIPEALVPDALDFKQYLRIVGGAAREGDWLRMGGGIGPSLYSTPSATLWMKLRHVKARLASMNLYPQLDRDGLENFLYPKFLESFQRTSGASQSAADLEHELQRFCAIEPAPLRELLNQLSTAPLQIGVRRPLHPDIGDLTLLWRTPDEALVHKAYLSVLLLGLPWEFYFSEFGLCTRDLCWTDDAHFAPLALSLQGLRTPLRHEQFLLVLRAGLQLADRQVEFRRGEVEVHLTNASLDSWGFSPATLTGHGAGALHAPHALRNPGLFALCDFVTNLKPEEVKERLADYIEIAARLDVLAERSLRPDLGERVRQWIFNVHQNNLGDQTWRECLAALVSWLDSTRQNLSHACLRALACTAVGLDEVLSRAALPERHPLRDLTLILITKALQLQHRWSCCSENVRTFLQDLLRRRHAVSTRVLLAALEAERLSLDEIIDMVRDVATIWDAPPKLEAWTNWNFDLELDHGEDVARRMDELRIAEPLGPEWQQLALNSLAWCLHVRGDLDGARDAWERLIALSGRGSEFGFWGDHGLAHLAMDAGDAEDAERRFRALLDRAERDGSLPPVCGWASRIGLAEALVDQGLLEDAQIFADGAEESRANFASTDGQLIAELDIVLARIDAARGNTQAAVERLRLALQCDAAERRTIPIFTWNEMQQELADILMAQDEFEAAEAGLDLCRGPMEAVRLLRNGEERWACQGLPHPRVVRLWKQHATLYQATGRPTAARPFRERLSKVEYVRRSRGEPSHRRG